MRDNNVLYQYKERGLDILGWIVMSCIIIGMFILSILMVLWPIEMFIRNGSIGNALLLLLIPIGGWIAIKAFSNARTLIWQHNHPTTYSFYRNHFQLDKWTETYAIEPQSVRIELSTIQKIVLAPYIVNETRLKYGRIHIDKNHIMYVFHSPRGKQELFMLPFPNREDEINIWLKYFQERNIPLAYTNEILYRMDRETFTDEERMARLNSNPHLIPLVYNQKWKQLREELSSEWNNPIPQMEEVERGTRPVVQISTEETKNKPKAGFPRVIGVTILVFIIMIGAAFGIVEITENGVFSALNPFPVFVVYFISAILYFYLLRKYLRWYYMLILAVKIFIFAVIAALSIGDSNEITSEIGTNFIAASIITPLFILLPYGIIKLLHLLKS